jgi:hypothetical protein
VSSALVISVEKRPLKSSQLGYSTLLPVFLLLLPPSAVGLTHLINIHLSGVHRGPGPVLGGGIQSEEVCHQGGGPAEGT